MSHLFKQPDTKPIPANAKIIVIQGKKYAEYENRGKLVQTPLNSRGDRIRKLSKKWYGRIKNAEGKWRKVPLCTDKKASQIMLANLVKNAELRSVGVFNPYEDHQTKPLAAHIDDFETMLAAKPITKKQVKQKTFRVRELLLKLCGFKKLEDLNPQKAQIELMELPHSEQTKNYYSREARSFTRWMVKKGRMPSDPFLELEPARILKDYFKRPPLQEKELDSLLVSVAVVGDDFRGLSGVDRKALYMTAAYTGFRRSELAKLRPESFQLDQDPPVVILGREFTKNKKAAFQPLDLEVSQWMRRYLKDKQLGQPVWPGTWWERSAKMFRKDLENVGISPVRETPQGRATLNFHSLRHTYVHLLNKAGVSTKDMAILARHSDPEMTVNRYGQDSIAGLGKEVNKVNESAKRRHEELKAKILDDPETQAFLKSLPPAYPKGYDPGPSYAAMIAGGVPVQEARELMQSPFFQTSGSIPSEEMAPESISGEWDRTTDTRLMKPEAEEPKSLPSKTYVSGINCLPFGLTFDFLFHRLARAWPTLPEFAKEQIIRMAEEKHVG